MAAERGSKLIIRRGDGATPTENFTKVGSVQNATFRANNNVIDVTTGDDVDVNDEIWQSFITGAKNVTIAANGIAKNFLPIQDIWDDYEQGRSANYEVVVPNLFNPLTAAFLVADFEGDGPYDGAGGFSITLQMSGPPASVVKAT